MLPPVARGADGDEEPEQGGGEVDPYGILHAHDGAVAASLGMEEELGDCVSKHLGGVFFSPLVASVQKREKARGSTYLGKDAKERNVEDKQDQVPDRRNEAERVKHKRDQVRDAGDARKAADDNSKDLEKRKMLAFVGQPGTRTEEKTHPFRLDVDMGLAPALDVGRVQADDGEP